MQCKDIPDRPILDFVREYGGIGCNWFGNEFERSVTHAMPADVPDKLALAKMKMLIRRGLVGGCTCGCRGDFELTPMGEDIVGKATKPLCRPQFPQPKRG